MKKILLPIALIALSSCAGYERFTQGLNDRKVTSCISYTGTIGGMFSGQRVVVEGFTATGGAELSLCEEWVTR